MKNRSHFCASLQNPSFRTGSMLCGEKGFFGMTTCLKEIWAGHQFPGSGHAAVVERKADHEETGLDVGIGTGVRLKVSSLRHPNASNPSNTEMKSHAGAGTQRRGSYEKKRVHLPGDWCSPSNSLRLSGSARAPTSAFSYLYQQLHKGQI